MNTSNSIHVIPRSDGCAVVTRGSDRALRIHTDKTAAFRQALEYATRHSINLFIHEKTGTIVASFAIDALKTATTMLQCIDMLYQDGENTKKTVRETLQHLLGID